MGQKFDVFNEAWINSREKQGYKFLSYGLFQCRIQGLHSPDFDIKICVILVDERYLITEGTLAVEYQSRVIDGYIFLIAREFIGQKKTITLNEE